MRQGKPYAATEFGCCTFRGAADVAGRTEPVTYDEHGRAATLTAELERDEEGQARYLVDLLRDYEAGGVDAAFVYTFANRHLPTTGDPEHDYDLASRGIVRVLPDGDGGLVVDTNGTARSEVVAELVRAGIGVDRVVPRRRLEDAFLALVGENSRGSGDR